MNECPSSYVVDAICNPEVFSDNMTLQTNNTKVTYYYYHNFKNNAMTINVVNCSFCVKTKVCDNILGNQSEPLHVILKGKYYIIKLKHIHANENAIPYSPRSSSNKIIILLTTTYVSSY